MEWILIITVVIICIIAALTTRASKKTATFKRELQDMADRLHMRQSENPDLPDKDLLDPFYLFQGGKYYQVRNLLERSLDPLTVRFFEYRYCFSKQPYGKAHRMHTRSVVFIHNPNATLPKFEMYPENFLNKICDKIAPNPQDIVFEHHPQFSSTFMFETEDQAATRQLFSDQVIEQLEKNKKVSISANKTGFVFYRKLKPKSAEQIEEFILESLKVYEFFCSRS